jgi:hypothetical protein
MTVQKRKPREKKHIGFGENGHLALARVILGEALMDWIAAPEERGKIEEFLLGP